MVWDLEVRRKNETKLQAEKRGEAQASGKRRGGPFRYLWRSGEIPGFQLLKRLAGTVTARAPLTAPDAALFKI